MLLCAVEDELECGIQMGRSGEKILFEAATLTNAFWDDWVRGANLLTKQHDSDIVSLTFFRLMSAFRTKHWPRYGYLVGDILEKLVRLEMLNQRPTLIRSSRRLSLRADVSSVPLINEEADPHEQVTQQEMRSLVEQAVSKLSQKLREVIWCRYYESLSTQQIADHLGIRPSLVASRIRDAKKILAEDLKALDPKKGSDTFSRTRPRFGPLEVGGGKRTDTDSRP
jgi:RNA polymerase sigma factor (sigma-70 family)